MKGKGKGYGPAGGNEEDACPKAGRIINYKLMHPPRAIMHSETCSVWFLLSPPSKGALAPCATPFQITETGACVKVPLNKTSKPDSEKKNQTIILLFI